ncbi:MAG TPA: hypothetical protein VF525_01355 [Pyrinomonadaceae bacterium]|jgi:hypothetical protein
MFGRPDNTADEQLDRTGQMLVRAAADNDAAAETAVNAPFLYARVRARIATAQAAERNEADEGWLALLGVARRAVPALTGVAAFVFALMLWLASGSTATANGFGDEAYYGTETGVERTVLASRDNLSGDEVLSIIVDREERGQR